MIRRFKTRRCFETWFWCPCSYKTIGEFRQGHSIGFRFRDLLWCSEVVVYNHSCGCSFSGPAAGIRSGALKAKKRTSLFSQATANVKPARRAENQEHFTGDRSAKNTPDYCMKAVIRTATESIQPQAPDSTTEISNRIEPCEPKMCQEPPDSHRITEWELISQMISPKLGKIHLSFEIRESKA